MKAQLQLQDFVDAAKELNCEVAAIRAVAEVESAGRGFNSDDTPVILFEAHVFSRLTKGKYDKTHPNLSSPRWNKALYGPSSRQHQRLQAAAELDRDAALMSCSWGKFQLMGNEWKENGYKSLQDFINAMYRSERDHLNGFVSFVKRKAGGKCWAALRNKNWATFAYYYNGAGYKQNAYDVKMAQAYARYSK